MMNLCWPTCLAGLTHHLHPEYASREFRQGACKSSESEPSEVASDFHSFYAFKAQRYKNQQTKTKYPSQRIMTDRQERFELSTVWFVMADYGGLLSDAVGREDLPEDVIRQRLTGDL